VNEQSYLQILSVHEQNNRNHQVTLMRVHTPCGG